MGHRLMFTKNGIEAINAIENNSDIDLVLMDLKMPEMNGYEATKKIRKLNTSIPVIAITAFAFEEDRKRISNSDFDDYVVKPVDREILLTRIEKIIISKEQIKNQ